MNVIINVNKEKGWTSQDVCSKLKGILGQKKIGHTGTLDPNAQGVLPVCAGKATKLCSMITDWGKTYEAECILGLTTDSYDITGSVTSRCDVMCDTDEVKRVINSFVGNYDQYPPIFSARKVNGKKLYEYARSGKEVTISPKKITIYSIEIIEMKLPKFRMVIKCSKGTYIRSLCHDIGQALGCGGVMGDLIRTNVGPFGIEGSHTISELQSLKDSGRLDEALISIDSLFGDLPYASVSEDKNRYIYNGNSVRESDLILKTTSAGGKSIEANDPIRLYDSFGTFIGIYKKGADSDRYKPILFAYDQSAPLN